MSLRFKKISTGNIGDVAFADWQLYEEDVASSGELKFRCFTLSAQNMS